MDTFSPAKEAILASDSDHMESMKKGAILVGSGGHARVVQDIVETTGEFQIVGVVTADDGQTTFRGHRVLGGDDVLPAVFNSGICHAFNGIGGYRDNSRRRNMYLGLKKLGFNVPALVHPSAIVSASASISDGCVLFPGVVLNTDVALGSNVVIASGASVDHESQIADHVLISAGVTIGGNVTINEGALVAIGATVVSGVTIGERALVGAGAVVVKDVPPGQTVVGVPARPLTRKG